MNKTITLSLLIKIISNGIISFTLCILRFFTACTKKGKQDEFIIKGYLEVEAVCIESIGKEEVMFTGFLVDVYNKTQNSGFRHGTVSYKKTLTPTNSDYQPASEVKFSQIPSEIFSQSAMQLNGLSSRSTNRDVFKTSCDIRVLKRLNHQPK